MNERTMKLQAENDALPRQVAAQKAQFDALEARLKKLEQAAPVRRKTKRRKKMTKSFYQPVVFAAFLLSLIVAVVNAQSIEQSVIASGGTSEGGNSTARAPSVSHLIKRRRSKPSSRQPSKARFQFRITHFLQIFPPPAPNGNRRRNIKSIRHFYREISRQYRAR
jgi:anti-sigma factor RsiW